jgi:hypothetical protein
VVLARLTDGGHRVVDLVTDLRRQQVRAVPASMSEPDFQVEVTITEGVPWSSGQRQMSELRNGIRARVKLWASAGRPGAAW